MKLYTILALLPFLLYPAHSNILAYVDYQYTPNGGTASTGDSAIVKCIIVQNIQPSLELTLHLKQLDGDAYEDLAYDTLYDLNIPNTLTVYLSGITQYINLRCDLSYTYDDYSEEHTDFTIKPGKLPTYAPPSNVDAYATPIYQSATTLMIATTRAPTSPKSFTSTPSYIIYIFIISVFLITFSLTICIACWLTVRIRINRARLLRARQDYNQAMQNSVASPPTQGEAVVITHLQQVRRQGMPPSYFESESHISSARVNTQIDSAPPCYYEIVETALNTRNLENFAHDVTNSAALDPPLVASGVQSADNITFDNEDTLLSPLIEIARDDPPQASNNNNKLLDTAPTAPTNSNNRYAEMLSEDTNNRNPEFDSQLSSDSCESIETETAQLIN